MSSSESRFLNEFPEEVQSDVEGLLFLGHLEQEVKWCGHTFVLRTLRIQEELQIGLITKEFVETFGQVIAFAAANVALSLVSVDGDENFHKPLGPSDTSFARTRFDYVTDWYQPTISHLYKEYQSLSERQSKAVKALEDLSSGSRKNFWPLADSLKIQGDFPKPSEDITEFLAD